MLCEVSIILQNLLANCYDETNADMICTQLCSDYINQVNDTCLHIVYSVPDFEGVWTAFVNLCDGH
jgi:hypothetical protein